MSNKTSPEQTESSIDQPLSESIHAVLVPGFWLGAWAWAEIEPGLRTAGITTHAVTLPGLDGRPTEDITLEDHIGAVAELAAGLDGRVVLVGHSGGGTVVQGVVDRDPTVVDRVVYVDSGPLKQGCSLRPGETEDVPLPSWDQLASEGATAEGLDEETRQMIQDRAVPHPVGVATAAIELNDSRRFEVPASLIGTSLRSDQLREMIEAGHIPSELLSVTDVRYVDLPTGHWPMFSKPAELTEVLREEICTAATAP